MGRTVFGSYHTRNRYLLYTQFCSCERFSSWFIAHVQAFAAIFRFSNRIEEFLQSIMRKSRIFCVINARRSQVLTLSHEIKKEAHWLRELILACKYGWLSTSNVRNYFYHMKTFLSDCLAEKDVYRTIMSWFLSWWLKEELGNWLLLVLRIRFWHLKNKWVTK